jgi:hypothetical protein
VADSFSSDGGAVCDSASGCLGAVLDSALDLNGQRRGFIPGSAGYFGGSGNCLCSGNCEQNRCDKNSNAHGDLGLWQWVGPTDHRASSQRPFYALSQVGQPLRQRLWQNSKCYRINSCLRPQLLRYSTYLLKKLINGLLVLRPMGSNAGCGKDSFTAPCGIARRPGP